MHQSLRRSSVKRVKTSLQPVAEAAAAGSLHALHKILGLISNRLSLPDEDALSLLPAIFANLDPAGVPDSNSLDNLLSSACPMLSIDCARTSLRAIWHLARRVPIPLDLCPDLWLRIWKWVEFIHTYWSVLPVSSMADETSACLEHAGIIVSLSGNQETYVAICNTPGVRRILAVSWTAIVHSDSLCTNSSTIGQIIACLSILTIDRDAPGKIDEIVEGAGGTVEDVANTVVRQFMRAAEKPRGFRAGELLSSCMALFGEGGPVFAQQLGQALKIIVAAPLLAVLSAFHGVQTDSPVPLAESFKYLLAALQQPPGSPYIVQALDAGLLRVIALYGSSEVTSGENKVHEIIKEILGRVLPCALTNYNVVSHLKRAFHEADGFAIESKFDQSKFSGEWKAFCQAAVQRIALLDFWESNSRRSFKACDNMKCGEIGQRSIFKCCAGCRSTYYCSKECQSVDWCDGHRKACPKLRSVRLRHPDNLSTREKSFLRELVSYDYISRLPDVCIRQVIFMNENPGEPFCTVFQYATPGELEIEVMGIDFLKPAHDWEAFLPTYITRAARSGRRMELHVVGLQQGRVFRPVLLPMRTATPEVPDALLHSLQLVPLGKTVADAFPAVKEYLEDVLTRIRRGRPVMIH
ncbi:hypothetical protein B0H11DRAFT_1984417 [Mycena galericulata]|nr:hypothetical protein B0H11DRAFT_1984417 [Mycena galericulata]